MRTFGKIETSIWQKPKYRGLSPEAKLLWVYLLACPHGNAIGCFVLPFGYVMADLGWSPETVSERVRELLTKGFIEYDESSSLVRIRGWWGHNTIENANVAKAAVKAVATLPQCEILANYLNDLNGFPNAFRNAFANAFPNGWPTGFETKEPEMKPEMEPDTSSLRSDDPGPDEIRTALDAYNQLAGEIGLPVAQKLTDRRRASLKARLADGGGLDGWATALARVRDSPYLRGQNDRGWRADFDFLLQERSFTKLMEGSYDHRSKPRTERFANGFAALAAELGGGPGGNVLDAAGHGSAGPPGGGAGGPGRTAGAVLATRPGPDDGLADEAWDALRWPDAGGGSEGPH